MTAEPKPPRLTNAEKQARYRERKRLMTDALRRIATEARTLTEARQIAATAIGATP